MTIFKNLYKKAMVFIANFLFISISLGMLGKTTTINLQDGFYKIKNIETGKYVTIINERTGTPAYGKDLRMLSPITSGSNVSTQIFKITRDGDWYKILGTLNNNYTTGVVAVLDVGFGTAYFYNGSNSNIYRKIKLTANTMTPMFVQMSCQQSGPDRFLGVESENLALDEPNNKFMFEPTVVPFNDGDLVTIKSYDNKYFQMPKVPISGGYYQGSFAARNALNPSQTFMIKKYANNEIAFIGTINGDYTGANAGLLRTAGVYSARFVVNKTTPGSDNLFKLLNKGTNSFAILNKKFNKFEAKSNTLLKDINEPLSNLPAAAIFTIEKESQIEESSTIRESSTAPTPVTPFQTGDKVRIKGIARTDYLKRNVYLTIPTTPDANGNYFAKFQDETNQPNQIFEVKSQYENAYAFVGIKDGNYTGNNVLNFYNTAAKFSTHDLKEPYTFHQLVKLIPKPMTQDTYALRSLVNNFEYEAGALLNGKEIDFANLSSTSFFKITKVTPTPPIPVTPFQSGKFVSIKDSSPNGKYMELTTEPAYMSVAGRYGVKFGSKTLNKPTQVFKVMVSGNNTGFIGSINNNYAGNNAGLLDAYYGGQNSYFYKGNYTFNNFRKFQLFSKESGTYGLFNVQNQRFENASTGNKLIETNQTLASLPSSAIFEIKETAQIEETTQTEETANAKVIDALNAQITDLQSQIQEQRNIATGLNAQLQPKKPIYQAPTSRYSRRGDTTAFGGTTARGRRTTTSGRRTTPTRPTTRYQTRGRR